MKNPFETSSRESMPRQSENTKKEIRVLYDDPIVFGNVPEPADESPPPEPRSFLGDFFANAIWVIPGLLLLLWGIGHLLGGHSPEMDSLIKLIHFGQ